MKILLTIVFVLAAAAISFAQEAVYQCPPNLVCISQAAANKAAENARELAAQKEKAAVLENALREKDKSIEELKQTNASNVGDLKEALRKTEIELARLSGQLTARESEVVRQSAIITALLPMVRKKKIGIINIF